MTVARKRLWIVREIGPGAPFYFLVSSPTEPQLVEVSCWGITAWTVREGAPIGSHEARLLLGDITLDPGELVEIRVKVL